MTQHDPKEIEKVLDELWQYFGNRGARFDLVHTRNVALFCIDREAALRSEYEKACKDLHESDQRVYENLCREMDKLKSERDELKISLAVQKENAQAYRDAVKLLQQERDRAREALKKIVDRECVPSEEHTRNEACDCDFVIAKEALDEMEGKNGAI